MAFGPFGLGTLNVLEAHKDLCLYLLIVTIFEIQLEECCF